MKTNLLLITCLFSLSVQAQQLINPGFENWASSPSIFAEIPEFYSSSWEILTGVPTSNAVIKTTDAYSGAYALKVSSIEYSIGQNLDTIYGSVFMDPTNSDDGSAKFSFTHRPDSLIGYYKANIPDLNYGPSVVMILYSAGSPVGSVDFKPNVGIQNYTRFSVPFVYFNPSIIPDSANFFIQSLSMSNSIDQFGPPGMDLYLDDIELIYNSVGIDAHYKVSNIQIYPNPASSNLDIVGTSRTDKYMVLDYVGRTVMEGNGKDINTRISIENLMIGPYILKIEKIDGSKVFSKFLKK